MGNCSGKDNSLYLLIVTAQPSELLLLIYRSGSAI